MTLLAMLRHGQTQWNVEGRIQGRTDVPLNEAGRLTLSRLRVPDEFLRMRVAVSPLQRCAETALTLKLMDLKVEPRIAEMSWGKWEGHRLSELRAEHGDRMFANENQGFDFMPPLGESPRQVLMRVSQWLGEVAQHGRPTLAISHKGVIRVVFAAACGWDMRGRPPFRLDWSALQVFRLDSTGHPDVMRLNVPLVPAPPDVLDV